VAKIMMAVQQAYIDQQALEEERARRAHHDVSAGELADAVAEAAGNAEEEGAIIAAARDAEPDD